jgi:hypothetical protein
MCVLQERGFVISEMNAGRSCEDIIARKVTNGRGFDDPLATWAVYSVEVKHHKKLDIDAFRKQAKENAKKAHAKWLLLCRIPRRPYTFYVEGQGMDEAVWHGNEARRTA